MFQNFILLFSLATMLGAATNVQRSGKYEVTLREPEGGLSAQEEMQIEFRVVDTSRVDPVMGAAGVIRARIEGVVEMPAMAGMPKVVEIAHPEGVPGEYGLHPMFAHGGEFKLTLKIAPPAGQAFEVSFPLQVGDARSATKATIKPYRLEVVSSPKNPKAGEPADLTIRVIRDATKEPITAFDLTHEHPLHLIVVRADLGVFAHLHPALGENGVFRVKHVFPTGGEYHLFADAAPRAAGSQVLMAALKVNGKSEAKFDLSKADRGTKRQVQGVVVDLDAPAIEPVKKSVTLRTSVRDAQGNPVTNLEPYLGAMGHFILIHEDGVTMVHSHPDERGAGPDFGKDGVVPFLSRFPKPGLYRGWAQFQRAGTVITADFILEAGGPAK
ncbi:MAG: hypothetical protein ABI823_10790 [Bryobacteraceae bacterium]